MPLLTPSASSVHTRAASPNATSGTRTAEITFFCTEGLGTPLEVDVYFLSKTHSKIPAGTFKETGNPKERTKWPGAGQNIPGQIIQGTVSVPDEAVRDVIGLQIHSDGSKTDREYINRIKVSFDNNETWILPTNTWIHSRQGVRFLFGTANAYLPGDEPEHLATLRKDELEALRVCGKHQERKTGDRMFDYEPYNDLGDAKKNPPVLRPVLGNVGGWAGYRFPYPRRIRTGRQVHPRPPPGSLDSTQGPLHSWKTIPQLYEERVTVDGIFWVPLDEGFSTSKQQDFNSYTLMAGISAVNTGVNAAIEDLSKKPTFESFADVDDLYDKIRAEGFVPTPESVVKGLLNPYPNDANPMDRNQRIMDLDVNKSLLSFLTIFPRAAVSFLLVAIIQLLPVLAILPIKAIRDANEQLDRVKALAKDFKSLFTFPQPLVWAGRKRAWMMDTEFGRQALAGVNPCTIKAARQESDVPDEIWSFQQQIEAHTEGKPLKSLLAKGDEEPRLLVIDHTAVFEEYAPEICELPERHGYSGLALLYRRDDPKDWVPIAIQLTDGATGKTTVYTPTPSSSPKAVQEPPPPGFLWAKPYMWLLVRGVFTTLDSAHHQLITHWLRTHACTEPYIIATRRQLSCLHPVHKLLMPHFAYTMQINANARANLISMGGIIEDIFTPKEYSMRMSAEVYDKLWEFDTQSLPKDLAARGLAKLGGEKGRKVEKLLLEDYPYAADGLMLWEAIEEWVGAYLKLYYREEGAVVRDWELMGWWTEIQAKGHPDKTTGWPELKDVDDLTYILTTMIWTASCHHAAINFSQYGYSGFALNRPVCTYKPLPAEGSTDWKKVQGPNAPGELHLGDDQPAASIVAAEKVYLDTLAATLFDTLKLILTVELLSTHAETESYINDPNHPYILDPDAEDLHGKFVDKLNTIKATIERSNKNPDLRMRQDPFKSSTQFPYTFLVPDSLEPKTTKHKAGVSNTGVPQSISI